MRKTLAILASIFFAIEISTIEFTVPIPTQILSTSVFLTLLFYLILKKEKLVDTSQSNQKVEEKTTTVTKEASKDKENKSKTKKEPLVEEESEFEKEWKELEQVAK